MSEQKESSVLFSLKELMNLEEDRIKSEEAEKAASAAAAEQARLEAERRAREDEEARIRAEEERRRQEELRAREETAKLEAIRHAEVEKARLDAEQKARMEAMAAHQEQERALAAIHRDEGKRKLRNMLIGGGVLAVIIIGVVGGVGYSSYVEKQEAAAQAAREQAELQQKLAKLEADLKAGQDNIRALDAQLGNAKDEATRAKLQAELDAAKAEQEKKQKTFGSIGGRPGAAGDAAPAKAACNCNPNDPLCDCF
jgi:colicin import membrane protein